MPSTGINEDISSAAYADKYLKELRKYKRAFEAAKAFIDSHVADPDITGEMCDRYAEYQEACKGIN